MKKYILFLVSVLCAFTMMAQDIDLKAATQRKFKTTLKKAEKGNAKAQNDVGVMYAIGMGVIPNQQKAFEWFEKAAQKKMWIAWQNLADCYFNGEGTEVNYKKAAELYKKAADEGESDYAIKQLGMCYYEGLGLSIDYKKAVKCFRHGADLGDEECMYMLALCYYDGNGVKKDLKKSFKFLDKCATYPAAIMRKGLMYGEGQGVAKNDEKAMDCFFQCWEQGQFADAANQIAYCYAYGKYGCQKDYDEALRFIDEAIDYNSENPDYYDTKGEIYLRMGDIEKATRMWKRVLLLDPKYANPDSNLYQYMRLQQ